MLVGSRRPADAYRLGQVLGELRRARRQREAGRSGTTPAAADGAPRPLQAPVVLATRARPATPATGRRPAPVDGEGTS